MPFPDDDDYQGEPLQSKSGATTHASVASQYNRTAAVAYAAKYWDKTCSDGFVGTSGKSAYREVVPATTFTNVGQDGSESSVGTDNVLIPWSELEDCTHFASCCIGSPWDAVKLRPMLRSNPSLSRSAAPVEKAGGLNIPGQSLGMGGLWLYGMVGAPQLVTYLISKGFAKTVTSKKLMTVSEARDWLKDNSGKDTSLKPGDLIAKAPRGGGGYSHVMFHAGNGAIYCHTKCRNLAPWAIDMTASYTLLKIL